MLNVIPTSVKDQSDLFSRFQRSLVVGSNYVVGVDAYTFRLKNPSSLDFTIEDLRALFPEGDADEIDILQDTSWDEMLFGEKGLEFYFSLCGQVDGSFVGGYALEAVPRKLVQARLEHFLYLTRSLIDLPPEKVYQVDPYDVQLMDFIMWGVTYILLNKGQGLVIAASASD